MRDNVIDFRTKEQKRADFKEKFNQEIQNAKNWIVNNKEWLITLTPEEAIKYLYCYDRSLVHYWRLRRELTNKERLEIDRLKNNGERLADILSEMKVLK